MFRRQCTFGVHVCYFFSQMSQKNRQPFSQSIVLVEFLFMILLKLFEPFFLWFWLLLLFFRWPFPSSYKLLLFLSVLVMKTTTANCLIVDTITDCEGEKQNELCFRWYICICRVGWNEKKNSNRIRPIKCIYIFIHRKKESYTHHRHSARFTTQCSMWYEFGFHDTKVMINKMETRQIHEFIFLGSNKMRRHVAIRYKYTLEECNKHSKDWNSRWAKIQNIPSLK